MHQTNATKLNMNRNLHITYTTAKEKKACPECGGPMSIEEYIIDPTQCEMCSMLTPCCGIEYDKDIDICPKCKEHV
jgi:hypothetical protein